MSSLQNPRVLEARKLRRRAGRDAAGAYLLEGTVPVCEALRRGAPVRYVFASIEHPDGAAIAARAEEAGVSFVPATPGVVEAVSDAATPQGVVAVVDMTDVPLGEMDGGVDLVLVLDQVRDPGNAGTLVRCATAAGAGAVVFTKGSVDAYAPKTVRASAGFLSRVDLVRDAGVDETAELLRGRGFSVVGTDAVAPVPYDAIDYTGPTAFVVGNEAWGIPADHRGALTDVVAIPMPGDAESLNAGIAGALLLFEAVRQRRGRHGSAEGGGDNPFGGTAD
ncbi:MAG TPA: RNA methyltransferase [Actinomycetota bacterium]|nr:RNA methyltransferase [Actinomycetota bacterium]